MSAEMRALIAKAKASLEAAEGLVRDGHFGFGASRAYYAMFYVAEALLVWIGQSYSSHSAVVAAFGKEFAKTGRLDAKFHRWLVDAADIRSIGDTVWGWRSPRSKRDRCAHGLRTSSTLRRASSRRKGARIDDLSLRYAAAMPSSGPVMVADLVLRIDTPNRPGRTRRSGLRFVGLGRLVPVGGRT